MLLPKNRLKENREFVRILKSGLFFNSQKIRLKIAKNHLKVSRFGFVASLAVDKRATRRNKLKRQMREIIRLLLKERRLKEGWDAVFFLSKKLKERNYEEMRWETEFLLKKSGLLRL
ncbi:MAG: ribonuclease P protein component [Candidatus Magasanikbacteria bacterium]|nr:ribonuclease P protein component [Candidatus Magasanikbacteria bacterium]